jgi:hypothetical protein
MCAFKRPSNKPISVRFSDYEREHLTRIARQWRYTPSGVVRMAVDLLIHDERQRGMDVILRRITQLQRANYKREK